MWQSIALGTQHRKSNAPIIHDHHANFRLDHEPFMDAANGDIQSMQMSVYIYMYTNMCIYIYTYVYRHDMQICLFVCIHVYVHIQNVYTLFYTIYHNCTAIVDQDLQERDYVPGNLGQSHTTPPSSRGHLRRKQDFQKPKV